MGVRIATPEEPSFDSRTLLRVIPFLKFISLHCSVMQLLREQTKTCHTPRLMYFYWSKLPLASYPGIKSVCYS